MADIFTAEISNPSSDISGSVASSDSTSAAIGSGLSGLAKILDVGIKAASENRMNKTLAKLENDLKAPVDAFTQEPEAPEVTGVVDQIEPYRQKNKQGKMSRSDFLARTSAIVQQSINENPRYADQIRKRAQDMLGISPTSSAVALQIQEQEAIAQARFAAKKASFDTAAGRGVGVIDPKTGELDFEQTARMGVAEQTIDNNMRTLKEDLEIGLKQEQLRRAREGEPAEISDAERRRLRVGMTVKNLLPAYENELGTISNTVQFAIASNGGLGSTASEKAAAEELRVRVGAFRNRLESYMDNAPELFDSQDADSVRGYYNKRIEDLEKLFTGPLSNVENNSRNLQMAKTRSGLEFHQVAPVMAMLADVSNGEAVRDMINTVFSARTKGGTIIAEEGLRVLQHASGIMHGDYTLDQVPPQEREDVARTVAVGLNNMNALPRAGKLDPNETQSWGSTTSATLDSALSLNNAGQVRKGASVVAGPGALVNLKVYEKVPGNEGAAKEIGAKMFDLHWKAIKLGGGEVRAQIKTARSVPMSPTEEFMAADPNTLGVIKVTPVFNARTNKVEIETTDAAGNPVVAPVNQSMAAQVQALNQSLTMIAQTKDYAGPKEAAMSESQMLRLATSVSGISLKKGTQDPLDPAQTATTKKLGGITAFPEGMVDPGTMSPFDEQAYPMVRNADGSQSNVRVMIRRDDDGLEVMIPTMVGGVDLGEARAWQHYKQTGEHFGKFETAEQALDFEAKMLKLLEEDAAKADAKK